MTHKLLKFWQFDGI